VEYFTALIHTGTKQDPLDIFKAKDFEDAIKKVQEKYPDRAYRLYKGKGIPEKKIEQKIPPTPPKS